MASSSGSFLNRNAWATQAREARREVEVALDATGWPWSRGLSLWIDLLVILEESPNR